MLFFFTNLSILEYKTFLLLCSLYRLIFLIFSKDLLSINLTENRYLDLNKDKDTQTLV